jgi:hypothetical protein
MGRECCGAASGGVQAAEMTHETVSPASLNLYWFVMSDEPARILGSVVEALAAIAGADRIWKRGVVHPGGPHYRLPGTFGPVGIGEDECLILGRLVERFRPVQGFIVGNGFGLSSVYLAKVMEANGGQSLITLDSKLEGDGERCFEVAERLRLQLDCQFLKNKYGVSPRDVPAVVEHESHDLIFIDGDHSHPQVTEDLLGVQHLLSPRGILCWHDYWLEGVSKSVDRAGELGFRCWKLNSSCEIVFGTRDEAIYEELRALFPKGELPVVRRRVLARLVLSRSFAWAKLRSMFRSG